MKCVSSVQNKNFISLIIHCNMKDLSGRTVDSACNIVKPFMTLKSSSSNGVVSKKIQLLSIFLLFPIFASSFKFLFCVCFDVFYSWRLFCKRLIAFGCPLIVRNEKANSWSFTVDSVGGRLTFLWRNPKQQ